MKLANIDDLIQGEGTVTLGQIGPVSCAAVANDGHRCLAMLIRREGEPLNDLLQRLDGAIERAQDHDEFLDEINC